MSSIRTPPPKQFPSTILRRAQTMPEVGRSFSSAGFHGNGDWGGPFQRTDSRVQVDLGQRQHSALATQESKASAQMRENFLQEAVWRDASGAIHVEDFGSVLRKPIKVSKWMPDDAAEGCRRCKRAFSLFRRRHHCRYCGDLVCAEESRANVVFAKGAKPARTCDRCLRRIVGRIDALFDRRYTRAAILNSPTKFNTPPLSPLASPAAAAAEDDGSMVFEDIEETVHDNGDGSNDGKIHVEGKNDDPESSGKGAEGAHLLTATNLRKHATENEQNASRGDGSNGSSRKRTNNGDQDGGDLSSPRDDWFLKAITASLLMPFGVVKGDKKKDAAAGTPPNLRVENNTEGDSSGSGDKEVDDKFGGLVERISSALLLHAHKDSVDQGDDDVESTDGAEEGNGDGGNDLRANINVLDLDSRLRSGQRRASDAIIPREQIVPGPSPAAGSMVVPALPPLQRSRSLGDVPSFFQGHCSPTEAAGNRTDLLAVKYMQGRVKSSGS